MNDQPEALRLADALQQQAVWESHYGPSYLRDLLPEAAAELRRLHAVNQELLEALRLTSIDCEYLRHAHKDRHLLFEECPVVARINAAIAKAEGQA
jgi:hypothetical protein